MRDISPNYAGDEDIEIPAWIAAGDYGQLGLSYSDAQSLLGPHHLVAMHGVSKAGHLLGQLTGTATQREQFAFANHTGLLGGVALVDSSFERELDPGKHRAGRYVHGTGHDGSSGTRCAGRLVASARRPLDFGRPAQLLGATSDCAHKLLTGAYR